MFCMLCPYAGATASFFLSFFQHTDAIEFLIHSYPKFVTVGSFPCDSAEDRVCCVKCILFMLILGLLSTFFCKCACSYLNILIYSNILNNNLLWNKQFSWFFVISLPDHFGWAAFWEGDYPHCRCSVVATDSSVMHEKIVSVQNIAKTLLVPCSLHWFYCNVQAKQTIY